MIIVDFQHLCYRNLFTCFYNCNAKKVNGKYVTEDYIGVFFYQMLMSLNKITNDFGHYGDIVIALDGFHNWRKDFIEREYKGSRAKSRKESDVVFDEFYDHQRQLEEFLKGFGKVIRVDRAEADDIGFVLSNYYNEKTLLITSDKDWKQHLIGNLNVDLYDPMKKEMLKNSTDLQPHLKYFRTKHILLGDKADEVPNVMYHTELHPDFISYLNSLKLDIKIPTELDEFIEKNGDEILQNYEGKIYKVARFGEKTVEKFIANPKKFIEEKVKDKEKFKKNLELNKKLVDIRNLPKEIEEEILNTFENTKIEDPNRDFIDKFNLHKCMSFKIGKKTINEAINADKELFDELANLF